MTAPEGQRDERAAWSRRLAARDVMSDPGGHCRRGFRYGYEDGLAASRAQHPSMTAPEPVVLTDGEREALRDSIADGRVADSHAKHGPPVEPALLDRVLRAECGRFVEHLAPAVERILADRLAADRAAHEALRERVTSLAGVINLERTSRPESWETVEWLSGLVERIEDGLRAALAAATPTPPQDAATEGGL